MSNSCSLWLLFTFEVFFRKGSQHFGHFLFLGNLLYSELPNKQADKDKRVWMEIFSFITWKMKLWWKFFSFVAWQIESIVDLFFQKAKRAYSFIREFRVCSFCACITIESFQQKVNARDWFTGYEFDMVNT